MRAHELELSSLDDGGWLIRCSCGEAFRAATAGRAHRRLEEHVARALADQAELDGDSVRHHRPTTISRRDDLWRIDCSCGASFRAQSPQVVDRNWRDHVVSRLEAERIQ